MASLPLRLKITPQTLALTALRPFSSSPFPDQNPSFNGENDENLPSPKSSHASLFSDIKERLRSPPRRIPCDPPPPSIASSIPNPATSFKEIRKYLDGFHLRSSPSMPSRNPNPPSEDGPTSFEEIRNSFEENRKHLAGFSLRSSPSMPSRNPNPPSEDGPISFQDLLKNRNNHQDPNSRPERGGRDPLRQSRPSPWDPPRIGLKRAAPAGPSLIGDRESLPKSIFGREMREEKVGEWEAKKLRTEFAKMYGYDELGEKLRMLRPENAEKGGKNCFSLEEINLRLAKLRELEDKEAEAEGAGRASVHARSFEGELRMLRPENAEKGGKN